MSKNNFFGHDLLAKPTSRFCRRFLFDSRGATAITFALTLAPLMICVGAAIDYSYKMKAQTDLRNAADAAALAAVINVKNNIQQNKLTFEQAKPLAENLARDVFGANSYPYKDLTSRTLTVDLARNGASITASIAYDVDLPGFFTPLVGIESLRVANISSPSVAKSQTYSFANYFLMVDVSASMGLPTTDSEQQRYLNHPLNTDLKDKNENQPCVFACHGKKSAGTSTPKDEWNGYRITRKFQAQTIAQLDSTVGSVEYCERPGLPNCIQLRTDAVTYAVNNLLTTIKKTERDNNISDQFQVGVFPFIVHLATLKNLTADIDSVSAIVPQIPPLLDNHDPLNYRGGMTPLMMQLGSGGTHFEIALPEMQAIIDATPGKGNGVDSGKRSSFVFLITDGMRDSQIYNSVTSIGVNGGNHSYPIDQSYCTNMKNSNVTLGILYIPYVTLVETSYGYWESRWANKAIPSLEPALQNCATPGYFFKANSPDDIDNALKKMFYQSMEKTVLSH